MKGSNRVYRFIKEFISLYYALYIIYYHPELNILNTQLKIVILWSNGVFIVYYGVMEKLHDIRT